MSSSPKPEAQAKMKLIAGADPFGAALKDHLVSHLRSHRPEIEVVDLGVGPYYTIGAEVGRRVSSSPSATRGLLACGTGAGVQMFANKFPGVYAAACLSPGDALNARSISDANVLSLSALSTAPDAAVDVVAAFLDGQFKAACPASGGKDWDPEIRDFLDDSLSKMPLIGKQPPPPQEEGETVTECAICCLAKNREFVPVEIMPGGMMKIVRETPTSAIVQFKAGSVEPAHHHTFGHDLIVTKGRKTVWNLTKKEKFNLVTGDFLFTPAKDVHRVKYHEDTEFFIKWDGHWDIFLDEDLETAKAAIEKGGDF